MCLKLIGKGLIFTKNCVGKILAIKGRVEIETTIL